MTTVSLPVYSAINGRFTTSVLESSVPAAGLHPPDTGSAVHASPAGRRTTLLLCLSACCLALSAFHCHFLSSKIASYILRSPPIQLHFLRQLGHEHLREASWLSNLVSWPKMC